MSPFKLETELTEGRLRICRKSGQFRRGGKEEKRKRERGGIPEDSATRKKA